MGKKKKKARKQKALAAAAAMPVVDTSVSTQVGATASSLPSFADPHLGDDSALLEVSRTRWQHANWRDLATLGVADVAGGQNRAKLMLLIAAAQGHMGQTDKARASAEQALRWGADRRLAAGVLLSAVQNSLGRVATCFEDDSAQHHFEEAIRLVEPRADIGLLTTTRQLRESSSLGYIASSLAMMETKVESGQSDPAGQAALLRIFQSELEQVKHELSLALTRGQLAPSVEKGTVAEGEAAKDLAAQAVSQLGQELWVLERTGYKSGGYFVEFGATDGLALSNTWLLEKKFGWDGLLAEPNPKFFKELQKNRNCTCTGSVISNRSGDVVEFIFADVFGGIADYRDSDFHADKREAYRQTGSTEQLETVSLDDFLKQNNAPRRIDYMSIDTEGNEFDILSAFPFDEWDVRLFSIEHNFTPQREKIRALMESNGYRCREVEWDDWYEKIDG